LIDNDGDDCSGCHRSVPVRHDEIKGVGGGGQPRRNYSKEVPCCGVKCEPVGPGARSVGSQRVGESLPVGDVNVTVVRGNVKDEVVVYLCVLSGNGAIDQVGRVVVDSDGEGGVDFAFVGIHAGHDDVEVSSGVRIRHIKLQ